MKLLYPEGVERRKYDLQRHRGQYIVPGPNFIWSVDGYQKLAPVGIEVYAGIDAYSRYVVWIYVGISSRTAVSVLRQYLEIVKLSKKQPRFLRSDRGTETMIAAGAHWKLVQCTDASLSFCKCYMYGTSTSNQRIESWWVQLSKTQLTIWRVSSPFLLDVDFITNLTSNISTIYEKHTISTTIRYLIRLQ